MKFSGNVTPVESYEALLANPDALMIDVRTTAEVSFVGIPKLANFMHLPWQEFPTMTINDNFAEALSDIDKSTPLYFICRSGARSMSAAACAFAAGFTQCFNVAEGFEGDRDGNGHRGTSNGWKAAGLPWVQG